MAKVCRKVRQSLFTKLAVVMVVGVIGINVISYVLYRQQQRRADTTLNRSLVQYARSLADEIGTPPNRAIAAGIAKERMMRVTLTGPDSWVIGGNNRRFPAKYLKALSSEGGVEIANLHGYYRLSVALDPASTVIFDLYPSETERASLRKFGLISLVGSCILMLVVYLFIRFLLRPIGWLTDGAANLRDGNLDTRVAERGRGELRELSETFNQMAVRLETLVKGQRELLLGVSHELRTPLTRLKLRLAMLDDSVDTSAIQKDLDEMEAMTTSILETAKTHSEAEGIKPQLTDIGQLLLESAEGFQEQAPGVAMDIPKEPLVAKVDPEKMRMALNMLLDNAIKYSNADSASVELMLRRVDRAFVITVKDHGIGIPAESISRLFEPFYRVDASRTRATGGYGLGLHLCHATVKAHGATIEVESVVGEGTLFRLVFPCAD